MYSLNVSSIKLRITISVYKILSPLFESSLTEKLMNLRKVSTDKIMVVMSSTLDIIFESTIPYDAKKEKLINMIKSIDISENLLFAN